MNTGVSQPASLPSLRVVGWYVLVEEVADGRVEVHEDGLTVQALGVHAQPLRARRDVIPRERVLDPTHNPPRHTGARVRAARVPCNVKHNSGNGTGLSCPWLSSKNVH